jgi:hypothetical protein
MPFSLVGTSQTSTFGVFNDPQTADVAYPSGSVSPGRLALLISVGVAATIPSGWTAAGPTADAGTTAITVYRILDGSESGTVARTVDGPGSGGTVLNRRYHCMIVLSTKNQAAGITWDPSYSGTPFNPSALGGQTTDEVIYIGYLGHRARGDDYGWSVVGNATTNWDGSLTQLVQLTDEHDDTNATDDPDPVTNSMKVSLATGPVIGGTIPATSNSHTWSPALVVTPSGPLTRAFLRSRQTGLEGIVESYVGMLGGPL